MHGYIDAKWMLRGQSAPMIVIGPVIVESCEIFIFNRNLPNKNKKLKERMIKRKNV